MLPLVLIFGIVLLPIASTLKCYECVPGISGTCTDVTTECPSHGSQCGALRMITYTGHTKLADVNSKSCTLTDQCGEMSLNLGSAKTIIINKCCTSDLCNTQPAPDPSKSIPNGKKCFSCDGRQCTNILNCQGNENYCISTTVDVGAQRMTMKGCASEALCTDAQTAEITGAIGAEISCCHGDYCNSASCTSAGVMPLLATLLSLVLFS